MMLTQNAIKHSDTAILTHGPASIPTETIILNTDIGARTLTGATQNIRDLETTDSTVMAGSTVKYMNIAIYTAPRPGSISINTDPTIGWLEYALVMVKESEAVVPITLIGSTTLQDICTKMYRNECIWTGCIPISTRVPNCTNLRIKVPRVKQKIKTGDEWRLFIYYRDVATTAVGTDLCRTILSTNFKSYN